MEKSQEERISYYEFGAEIIAEADEDDRGYYLKLSLNFIISEREFIYEFYVGARALLDTITTMNEPRENRLRKTVSRKRYAFESRDVDGVK